MPTYSNAVKIKLSAEEVVNIIRSSLKLPESADIRFIIGPIGESYMGDECPSGVTGVEATHVTQDGQVVTQQEGRGGLYDR